jgi:hypothetical protein
MSSNARSANHVARKGDVEARSSAMMSQLDRTDAERAVAALIETYRQGFLRLDPAQIASIWDPAIAFFICHSSVKLKASPALHEPTFRVSMVLRWWTSAGWRVIPEIERRGAALVIQ